jgi:hypothetical protein
VRGTGQPVGALAAASTLRVRDQRTAWGAATTDSGSGLVGHVNAVTSSTPASLISQQRGTQTTSEPSSCPERRDGVERVASGLGYDL